MNKDINTKKIFKFWYPLALTWLLMAVEGPFIAAVISRLADTKINLAAHGVAFSFALIFEAPIIMIMSAATALVKNNQTFYKLRNFTNLLNTAITLLMVIFLIPPVFQFVAGDLIGLPEEVKNLTWWATLILLPWPGAIGVRRFYQGILIIHNETRKVAYGTVFRLLGMSSTALSLYFFTDLPGVIVGASSLTIGVVTEVATIKRMAANAERQIIDKMDESVAVLTFKEIYKFYYPLAITSILSLGVHPMVTFFMGKAKFPLESLAVLPVINSLIFVFRAMGLSFQEVAIALIGDDFKGYKPLRNYALGMILAVIAGLTTIAYSPLAEIWFFDITGLTHELTNFAIPPLQIAVILPALTVIISFQRALLVCNRNTKPISYATSMEVIGIVVSLLVMVILFELPGAVAAAIAYLIGRIAANMYLVKPSRNAVDNHIKL